MVSMDDIRQFSKQFMIEFIELYKSLPCLWKVKSIDYMNKQLKRKAYDEIVAKFKTIYEDANPDFVKRKINSIRTTFRKEYKKVESSKIMNSSEIYEPSLWYYEHLSFLVEQEIMSPLAQHHSLEAESEDDSVIAQEYQFQKEPSNPSMPFKKKKTSHKDKNRFRDDQELAFINVCTTALSRRDNEFQAVGINVAAKLEKMMHTQQIYAELLINKVLFKGLLGNLTQNTELSEVQIINSCVQTNKTSQTTCKDNSLN